MNAKLLFGILGLLGICAVSAAATSTVVLIVDCGDYRGTWAIPSVVRSVHCATLEGGCTTCTLEAGRRYAFQPAKAGTAFELVVGAAGEIEVDPRDAAIVEGGRLRIPTVPLRVDAGPYVGGWKVQNVDARPPPTGKHWFEFRRHTIPVVPGVTYDLNVARPLVVRPVRIAVARDGSLTVVPPAQGTSSGFVFQEDGVAYVGLRTVCVHVEAPAGFRWAVNSGNWKATGSSARVLVPGFTYGLERWGGMKYEAWQALYVPDDPAPGWTPIFSATLPSGEVVRAFTRR